jgi:hypothetical protein
MATTLKWFGVRIALRTVAAGRAIGRDADYDADGTLLEERIVIVRARSPQDAVARVRRRAKRETISYKNAYGQVVRQELLKAWEAYELFDPPADGAEVFSRTVRVARTVGNRELGTRFAGPPSSAADQRRRRRFIASDLAEKLDVLRGRRLTSR